MTVELLENSKIAIEGVEGYLMKGALGTVNNNGRLEDVPNSLCVFKRSTMLASNYSEADIKERADYASAPRVKDGDTVFVEGVEYVVEYKNSWAMDFANLVEK